MGCGISKIDPEEGTGGLKRSHHNIRNIINNKSTVVDEADRDFVSSDDHHNGPRKSVSCNLLLIAAINNGGGGGNGVIEETGNVKRDDIYEDGHTKDSSLYHGEEDIAACPASPSFREYCTVHCGSSYDENDAPDEDGSQGERVHAAAQEKSLNSDGKAHESRSPERHTKSTRKGFRSAIHKPAGWISRSKK